MIIKPIKTIRFTDEIQLTLIETPQWKGFVYKNARLTPDQVAHICKKAIKSGVITKEELKKQFEDIKVSEISAPKSNVSEILESVEILPEVWKVPSNAEIYKELLALRKEVAELKKSHGI